MRNKIIAVDFDGTLCKNEYPNIGKPRRGVINKLLDEQKHGIIIILNTMREGIKLDEAVKWAEAQGLKFDYINDNCQEIKDEFGNNPRKIYADEYWDDHNTIIWPLDIAYERGNANV